MAIIYPFPQVTASGQLPALMGGGSPSNTGLGARELVAELHISPSAGNAAAIHVYDVATGIVLKDLLPPSAGLTDCFKLTSGEDQDGVDPTRLGVIVTGTDKANVYGVIR